MKRRAMSIGLAAALLVSIVVGTESPASAGSDAERDELAAIGSVTWGACDDPVLQLVEAECGMLSVPLDYSKPRGDKIQLALSRVRHTVPDEAYQGIMLVNPGGPGSSGLIFSILGFFVPGGAGFAYDWIGFDPRGVGSSVPSLSCIPDYSAGPRPPYDPTTSDIEQAWLDKAANYAESCGQAGGRLLDNLTTADNARDMNAIREALGERRINFYGFSYGTYLGQVFATLYPERVRRMVLDSNVDPRGVWYDANLEQDYAFEDVFQRFLDWVALHDDTYHLGATNDEVEAKYYAALSALAASPRGELGAAEWADAFLLAGYVQGDWPRSGAAFAAFVNDDDPAQITELFHDFVDTADDNSYAIYLATECADAHWPPRWSKWRRDNDRVAADAPFLTWGNAWYNAPCQFWPARSGNKVTVSGKKALRILLLGETHDAATPLSGSLEIRDRFRSSTLIATEGTTHANSLAGYACVDDAVAAYLLDGSLPERVEGNQPDVVCPAVPLPEPAVADGAAKARTAAALRDARKMLQARIIRR